MDVTRDEVAHELQRLLTDRFNVPSEEITPQAHFFDTLGLDSVDLLSALALDHAGLKAGDLDAERTGVVIGTGYAGMDRLEVEAVARHQRGWKAVPPEISMSMMPNVAAGFVSMELGAHGPVECVATACAAGAQ